MTTIYVVEAIGSRYATEEILRTEDPAEATALAARSWEGTVYAEEGTTRTRIWGRIWGSGKVGQDDRYGFIVA